MSAHHPCAKSEECTTGHKKFSHFKAIPVLIGRSCLTCFEASDNIGFEDEAPYDGPMRRAHDEHDGTLVAAVNLRSVEGQVDVDL